VRAEQCLSDTTGVPVGEYAPGAFGFVIDPDRHEQVEPSALSA